MAYEMKYGQIEVKKKDIPKSEPVFLFRAQDLLAEKYLRMYAEDVLTHTGDAGNYRKILLAADNFRLWQTKKLPD